MNDETKRPWRVQGKGQSLCITDMDSIYVVQSFTLPDFRPHEQRRADADLIVRAVNHFDALVAALRSIADTTVTVRGDGWDDLWATIDEMRATATKALAAIDTGRT